MGLVGVVACSKRKSSRACAAVELYQGRVFRASVELLRARGCVRLYVLSALHGVVGEGDVVAPYECNLYSVSRGERAAWSERAARELARVVGGDEVLAVVPAAYAGALRDVRAERLFPGLPSGKLFRALRGALATVR